MIDVSLFCYPYAPVASLATGLADAPFPVRVFVTEGVPHDTTLTFRRMAPHVTLYSVPFLSQLDYDRLLWTCSINFVRGEDSFVRAIWAGRPFIWQAYRQEGNAHLPKIRAFLDIYGENMPPDAFATLEKVLFLWNDYGGEKLAVLPLLSQLGSAPRDFTNLMASQADLATNVLAFLRCPPRG
jgi:uncharacterized repeat protein (TIGR03837 family)